MKSSIRIERRNDRCCQLYWGGAVLGCLLIMGCETRQPPAAPRESAFSTTASTSNNHPGTSITCVAFSHDGDFLATSSDDRTVKLWSVATEQETATFNGHTAEVLSVAFSPDGKTLASGSVDRTARLWSVTTRKEIATLTGHHDIVRSVAFSPDGQVLATGSWDGTAKLWNVAAGKELATLTGHVGAVKAVAFAPDGKTLATGSVDNTIKLWDVARRAELATLTGHSAQVLSLSFNADGKTLASGSEDRSIRLWDVDSHLQRGVLLASSKVWTVAFAPGDQLLASGQENGTVMIWDLKFKKARRTMRAEGRVYSAAFSPNGRKLATGGSPGGFVVHGDYESLGSGSGPAKPAVKPFVLWNLEPKPSEEGKAPNEAGADGKTKGPPKELAVDLGLGIELEMVLIPAGEFMMGSPASDQGAEPWEKPQHRVRITKPFHLGKYPVTQEQWEAVMGSNPSRFKGPTNPVEQVSWDDCQQFLGKLNAQTGKQGGKFVLPAEAQWEYACRAGSKTKYCFGDDETQLGEYAWYGQNSGGQPHPVGEKKPNAWGLYDMHGNVYEWCQDWCGTYGAEAATDPIGPATGSLRVFHGGGWYDVARYCRSAYRFNYAPGFRAYAVGLRVCLVPADK